MTISTVERVSEIQRLRVMADLLELMGGIEQDSILTREDINVRIFEIIQENFLHEPLDIYTKKNGEENHSN